MATGPVTQPAGADTGARGTLADLAPPALVAGGRRLPAEQVREQALRLAAGLRGRGVAAGDVVSFRLPPCPQGVLAYHACWALGAVPAPVHHRVGEREAGELRGRLRPRVHLDHPGEVDALLAARPAEPHPPSPDDLAVLLPTSGSGGQSKIVRHAHGRLAGKARLMVGVHGLGPGDAICLPAPLAHVSGLLNGVLLPGAAGMTVVLMPRWSPGEALHLLERERVTFMAGPPTYFVQLMADPSFTARAVASLRLLSCGGAGVSEAFTRRAARTFGAVVKRTYGSTEAPTVTTSHVGDPPETGWATDGRATGAVELRVDEASGELWVRGPELFVGYADPAQTAAALDGDGWFRTGDRARLDGGWLTVLGRLRDTVIRGGENVDPTEVEAVCERLPGVRQAVVVGVPDEEMGERVGLVVVADAAPTLAAVREHCRAAGLARFKTPERVAALDALPVLTVGKPDRAALRALLAEASG